jgi:hypothetical protein
MMVALVLAATFPLVLLPILLGSTGVKTNRKTSEVPMPASLRRAPRGLGSSRSPEDRAAGADLRWIAKGAKS